MGSDLNSAVSPVFGRCSFFLVIDEKKKLEKSIPNSALQAIRGAGIAAAQVVVSEGVKAVITGNVGPNAFVVLKDSGVRLYNGTGMSVKQAIEGFEQNQLSEISVSAGRFGPGGGGMGRGAGGAGGTGGGGGRAFGREL